MHHIQNLCFASCRKEVTLLNIFHFNCLPIHGFINSFFHCHENESSCPMSRSPCIPLSSPHNNGKTYIVRRPIKEWKMLKKGRRKGGRCTEEYSSASLAHFCAFHIPTVPMNTPILAQIPRNLIAAPDWNAQAPNEEGKGPFAWLFAEGMPS